MNILLITSLYPAYINEPISDIPYVVHYFCKQWKKEGINIRVINSRMVYPKVLNFIPKGKKRNRFSEVKDYKIDNIMVTRVPIIQYPRITHSKMSIRKSCQVVASKLESENYKPDLILCHMISPAVMLADEVKKRYYNVPLILTIHIGDIIYLRNKVSFNEFKKIHNNIDAYGFRSNSIKKLYYKEFSQFIKNKPSFIVNSGIDQKTIISNDKLKEKFNRKSIKLLTVANLIPRKNVDTIIKVIAEQKFEYDIQLNIIGIGEEEVKLRKLVSELSLTNRVKFLGQKSRDEVMEEMRESDIFILISRQETLGMVYLEAMAQGCICIGSREEGIDGIIIDGFNGYLCGVQNTSEIKEKLESAINLKGKEKERILNESINTIKNLTEDKVTSEYLENIKRVK